MLDPAVIRSELDRLRGRIRGLFVRYGVGKTLAIFALAMAVLFTLDRWLSLPAGVRLVLLAVTIAIVARTAWRDLIAPLRRAIGTKDVALQVEKHFPELDGRLISVLELDGAALDPKNNVSVALVDDLRAETETRLRDVSFGAILDPKPAWRMVGVAGLTLAIVAGYAVTHASLAGIFAHRLFGGDARWPQRTTLVVVFPETASHFVIEDADARPVRVKMARGASLPVTVRVDGVDPEYVELTSSAGVPTVPLVRSGEHEWTGRFRSVREDFSFQPRGGDDDGAGREVEVSVFAAPAVAAVEATLRYPSYTGLPPRIEPRGDLEAPVGTQIVLQVDTSDPVAEAMLVFEADKGQVALTAAAPPAGEATAPAPHTRFTGSFVVTESVSYAIHLTGENGFKNLEPANYAIVAIKDRAPVLRLLEPQLADLDVTANGIVPIRVAADDDFGIAELTLFITPHGAENPLAIDLAKDAQDPAAKTRMSTYSLLDFATTQFMHEGGARATQVGDSFAYTVAIVDNKEDEAGAKSGNRVEVKHRRIDIVSENELLRMLTERQIRRKDEVKQLRALQAEKIERLKGVIDDFAGSDGEARPQLSDVAALEVGQNQVTNRALRLTGEFADLLESYVFNRIDRSAGAERLIPLLVRGKRASSVIDGVDPAIYRQVVEQWAGGAFGELDVLSRLLDMLSAILDVGETLSPHATSALNTARLLTDDGARPAELRTALGAEEAALARIDQLLEKMDEWEDYQEILTLFRDLLDDQRDLNAKTRATLTGEEKAEK